MLAGLPVIFQRTLCTIHIVELRLCRFTPGEVTVHTAVDVLHDIALLQSQY